MNPEILDREPPHDDDAEKRALYAMIVDPRRRIDEIADILTPDDFYDGRNAVLFSALVTMHAEGRNIKVETLKPWLQARRQWEDAGAAPWFAEIMFVQYVDLSCAAENAKVVRDCSRRRTMIRTGEEMLRAAWDTGAPVEESLERAESALGTIELSAAAEHLIDGPTAAMQFLDRVEAIDERGEHLGITTGLWKFDDFFGGFHPGEYCILAADSSAGKTSLGAQIADWNASKGKLVYVASLEMDAVEMTQRLVCAISNVNSRKIRTRTMTPDDRARLVDGAQAFARHSIRIDPRTDLKVSDIRRAARRLLREGLALVMVDYIGLVEPDDYRASREQQVARISRGLKNLAKELNVPVMALCQLNRTHETTERPQLRRPERIRRYRQRCSHGPVSPQATGWNRRLRVEQGPG